MSSEEKTTHIIFKLPQDDTIQVYQGELIPKEEIDTWNNIFLFAPFDKTKLETLYYKMESQSIEKLNAISKVFKHLLPEHSGKMQSKKEYENLVKEGIDEINEGEFEKLVLSRKEVHDAPISFDLNEFFNQLCSEYPECYVYCLIQPNKRCWIGATPELLAKFDDKDFQTMALAGTKTSKQIANGETWTKKEQDEQEYVTNFILNSLKKTMNNGSEVIGPYDLKTGDLVHLCSEIRIKSDFRQSLTTVDKIHPTPAVSGVPQNKSIEYLSNHEGYDREYYSGYCGFCDTSGTMNLFVNLRCMQLSKEYFEFYAGAGITKDSNPKQEYLETSSKIQALKRYVYV